jgi:hypothetical protein
MRYKVNIQIMRVGNSTQDHATIVVVVEDTITCHNQCTCG